MIDLTGKHAIVCGSTRGIGRACAERLAAQGAAVTLVARDAELLADVAGGLSREAGQTHHTLTADFTDPPGVQRAVTGHLASHGPADVLVNNTGGPPSGPIFEAVPEAFERALRMHVVCNQLLVQAVVPGMKQRGCGRIINIISTSVREPIPGLGVSNTTRAAVAGWAKTLSGELGPFGITVNNVLPGYTRTDRLYSLLEKKAAAAGITVAALEERMQAEIPLRRFADPSETAAAVAFLASPEAAYISGVSLPVDGGRISGI